MKTLSDKLFFVNTYMDNLDIYADWSFVREKLLSAISERIFSDKKLFCDDIQVSEQTGFYLAGERYDTTDPAEYDELLCNGTLERYLIGNDITFYDKLYEQFAKDIKGEKHCFRIHSEWLMEYMSKETSYPAALEFFYEAYPDIVHHVLDNSTLESRGIDIEKLSEALNGAFETLSNNIKILFENDPEQDYSDVRVELFVSKPLGQFLSEEHCGGDARKLKAALEYLKNNLFVETSVYEGVYYGYNLIGYDHSSCEDNLPISSINTRDIAAMGNVHRFSYLLEDMDNNKEVGA